MWWLATVHSEKTPEEQQAPGSILLALYKRMLQMPLWKEHGGRYPIPIKNLIPGLSSLFGSQILCSWHTRKEEMEEGGDFNRKNVLLSIVVVVNCL
jgi:hypothetical protein